MPRNDKRYMVTVPVEDVGSGGRRPDLSPGRPPAVRDVPTMKRTKGLFGACFLLQPSLPGRARTTLDRPPGDLRRRGTRCNCSTLSPGAAGSDDRIAEPVRSLTPRQDAVPPLPAYPGIPCLSAPARASLPHQPPNLDFTPICSDSPSITHRAHGDCPWRAPVSDACSAAATATCLSHGFHRAAIPRCSVARLRPRISRRQPPEYPHKRHTTRRQRWRAQSRARRLVRV